MVDQCTYQSPNWFNANGTSPPPPDGNKPLTKSNIKDDNNQKVIGGDKTEDAAELQVELTSLREKLRIIENTIKTQQDGPLSPRKTDSSFSRGTLVNAQDSSAVSFSLSPVSKSRLPRTSISSLMNPLPVSGVRYAYGQNDNSEYSAESYLSHLGFDGREKIEFDVINMATLATEGKKYSIFGPLRHFSIMMQDKHLKSIHNEVIKFRKLFDKKPKNINLPDSTGAKMYESDVYQPQLSKCSLKDTDGKDKATFQNPDNLVCDILHVLPKLDDILMLIERYFKYVYPFLPCLSETLFMKDLKRVLDINDVKNSTQKIDHLNISEKIDYATVGILLIVLKFGQGTMSSNLGDINIVSPPKLSSKIIDISHLCLRKFALFTEPSVKIFQFGILYRCYHQTQGFVGVNENSPFIFNGMLTQMAFGMGLNRDPSKFENSQDTECENRRRFLWHMILHIDSVGFFTSGTNRLITKEYYDTNLPSFVEKGSNISNENLEIENITIKMIKIRTELDELLCSLTDIVCRLSPLPTSVELFGTLDKLDTALLTKFGPLSVLLNSKKSQNHATNIQRASHVLMYTNALTTIQTVYCHLIFYSEKKKNFVACRYLIAKLISIFMRVLVSYQNIVDGGDSIYGGEFDWLITSFYSKLASGSLLAILVCFFRVASARNKFSGNDSIKFGLLNTLLYNLFDKKIWNLYLPYAKKISSKSFLAWGLLKYHTLIQGMTEKAKVSTDYDNKEYNVFDEMSISDIQTFIELSDINLYTTEAEEPALRIRNILAKLRAGFSFESSHINQQLTYLDEEITEEMMNKEFLPSPYEDKYWGDLMSKEVYNYDYDALGKMMNTPRRDERFFM